MLLNLTTEEAGVLLSMLNSGVSLQEANRSTFIHNPSTEVSRAYTRHMKIGYQLTIEIRKAINEGHRNGC